MTATCDMDEYLLCDTKDTFDDALTALRSSSPTRHIILDCEGENLGQQGGSLSLINLRTQSKTFLIDVKLLDDSTLRPLFDILESSETTKVVFDGRMDFCELYHSRNVTLASVWDLQLADINSRVIRGEQQDKQLRRLSPYLRPGEVAQAAQRHCYAQVHKLSGLEGCLKEHGIKARKYPYVSHDKWLERPLGIDQLRYAANDVYAIDLLLDNFLKNNYINNKPLLFQSKRYITMWQDERPKRGDKFKNNALLPLDIIDHPYLDTTSGGPGTRTLVCNCCKRGLPAKCYPKVAPELIARRRCWVCRALDVKSKQDSNWDDNEDFDSPDENFCFGGYISTSDYDDSGPFWDFDYD